MNFVIEPLAEDDIEQCVNLLFYATKETILGKRDRESLKRLIHGDNTLTLVGKKNERIAGIISGTLQMMPQINFVLVADEESARQGLGSLLIDKFIEIVRKHLRNTSTYIMATLTTDNTAAMVLYLVKGFKVEGFLKEGYMGKDIVFLKRKL